MRLLCWFSKFRCHPSTALGNNNFLKQRKDLLWWSADVRNEKLFLWSLMRDPRSIHHLNIFIFSLHTHPKYPRPCWLIKINIYVREELAHFILCEERERSIKITQYNNLQLLFSKHQNAKNSTACSRIKFLSFHPCALWNGVSKRNGETLSAIEMEIFDERCKILSSSLILSY